MYCSRFAYPSLIGTPRPALSVSDNRKSPSITKVRLCAVTLSAANKRCLYTQRQASGSQGMESKVAESGFSQDSKS